MEKSRVTNQVLEGPLFNPFVRFPFRQSFTCFSSRGLLVCSFAARLYKQQTHHVAFGEQDRRFASIQMVDVQVCRNIKQHQGSASQHPEGWMMSLIPKSMLQAKRGGTVQQGPIKRRGRGILL